MMIGSSITIDTIGGILDAMPGDSVAHAGCSVTIGAVVDREMEIGDAITSVLSETYITKEILPCCAMCLPVP